MLGGAGWIRTPGAARASLGGIQPQFGHYPARQKDLCRREFVRLGFGSAPALSDSLRRQVEGRCSAMSNIRKLRVQIRAIVWRCSPEFLPRPCSSTAPCSRRNKGRPPCRHQNLIELRRETALKRLDAFMEAGRADDQSKAGEVARGGLTRFPAAPAARYEKATGR
jgi:hypothetical protein